MALLRRVSAQFCLQCGHSLQLKTCDDGSERPACPDCGWVHYTDPKVATGCLIYNDSNEVLLVKRTIDPVGKWVFPGGYVDRFEDPEPSACREVLEETGLTVGIESLQGIYRAPQSPVLVLVYRANILPDSEPPQALHECSEVAYFGKSEVPWKELAFSITERALKDGFAKDSL